VIFGIVASWHMLWWGLLKFEPFPARAMGTAPTIRCLVTSDLNRGLWSPVLFSRPSQSGFSASLIKSREPTQPPLESQQALELMVPMSAFMPIAGPSKPVALMGSVVEHSAARIRALDFSRLPADPYGVQKMEMAPPLKKGKAAASIRVPANQWFDSELLPETAGYLVLEVELDSLGWPAHVKVLEGDPATAWRERVVRRVYGERLDSELGRPGLSGLRLLIEWGGRS